MTWTLWPRRLSSLFRKSCPRSRQGPHHGPTRAALLVEELESRLLPSTLELISTPVSASGSQFSVTSGNAPSALGSPPQSLASSVSADGRFVLFLSDAANLVNGQVTRTTPGDAREAGLAYPSNPNVFLLDRTTNQVTLVSHDTASPLSTADQGSFSAALSSDGSTVAFTSAASNLLPGPYQGESLYFWSRTTNTITRLISAGVPPGQVDPQTVQGISHDGRYILYSSSALSFFSVSHEYLYDTVLGTNTLIDHRSDSASVASASSEEAALSEDGSTVAFVSTATDLVLGQNGPPSPTPNVFLWNRASDTSTLVSHTSSSVFTEGREYSSNLSISNDGSIVTYESSAPDLVGGVTSGVNLFYYTAADHTNHLVAHVRDPLGIITPDFAPPDAEVVSGDGSTILFVSYASDLVPGQSGSSAGNVFRYDISLNQFTLLTGVNGSATTGAGGATSTSLGISDDGRFAAYLSTASNIIPGETAPDFGSNVFLYDSPARPPATSSATTSASTNSRC